MKKIIRLAVSLLFISPLFGQSVVAQPLAATVKRTTNKTETVQVPIIKLGAPNLAKGIYARNVWDMQSFGGHIFIGGGDSAANSGTTPVWALDPTTDKIALDFITDDEQVDEFTPLDDTLYITGHDSIYPVISRIYKLENARWGTWATLSGPAHLFSLSKKEGTYYVAGGDWKSLNDVWKSSDGGKTWTGTASDAFQYKIADKVSDLRGARAYLLFQFKGDLYAVRDFSSQSGAFEKIGGLQKLNAVTGQFEILDMAGAQLVPDLGKYYLLARYKRWVTLSDGSALTLVVESVNDEQWNPLALYRMKSIAANGISKVALPAGVIPYDLIGRGAITYVLAWNGKQVLVYSLDRTVKTTEIIRFDAPTFARSFEEVKGTFYFGLGSDLTPLAPNCGEIWKVSLSAPAVR